MAINLGREGSRNEIPISEKGEGTFEKNRHSTFKKRPRSGKTKVGGENPAWKDDRPYSSPLRLWEGVQKKSETRKKRPGGKKGSSPSCKKYRHIGGKVQRNMGGPLQRYLTTIDHGYGGGREIQRQYTMWGKGGGPLRTRVGGVGGVYHIY